MTQDLSALHGGGIRLVLEEPAHKTGFSKRADLYNPERLLLSALEWDMNFDVLERENSITIPLETWNDLSEFLPTGIFQEEKDRERPELPIRLYGRIGSKSDKHQDRANIDRISRLGDAIIKWDGGLTPSMGHTPAAYTYFGQFLAHELTRTEIFKTGSCIQLREGGLELETIYTRGADGPQHPPPHIDAADDLWLGATTSGEFFDLPREVTGLSMIRDRRNDQNLGVAQIQVATTRFAREATRRLKQAGCGVESARRIVLRHFQSVVLHDYLPRLTDLKTYHDIIEHGRLIVSPSSVSAPYFVPIEFAAAAFRFGHSMPRVAYQPWNLLDPKNTVTSSIFSGLLKHTYEGGGLADGHLKQNWTVDWRQLLATPSDPRLGPNRASKIDTWLSADTVFLDARLFQNATPFATGDKINLAKRTLLTGQTFQLPTGQEIAKEINLAVEAADYGLPVRLLQPYEIEIPGNPEATSILLEGAEGNRLVDQTPLWIYVLREAEFYSGGERLGPVGSRIVIETFHAAIEASGSGMIKEGKMLPFHPLQEFGGEFSDRFELADLVRLSGQPLLN